VKGDANKVVSTSEKLIKIKEKISFSSVEASKTKTNLQINKQNIFEKSVNEIKNTPMKNVSKVTSTASKQNISVCDEDDVCKRKRPRISIISDDEDDKNFSLRDQITIKETAKPIKKELPKQNVNKSMSKVVVVPPKFEVSFIIYFFMLHYEQKLMFKIYTSFEL